MSALTDTPEARAPLADGDYAGILIRAAEQDETAASLHRGAIANGLTDDPSVAEWCEKRARTFRIVAARFAHPDAGVRGRFAELMGSNQQPADLEAYAAELEQIVVGAKHRADQWRFTANEMGYEPNAHEHPPLNSWLQKRIAPFRRTAALALPIAWAPEIHTDSLGRTDADLLRLIAKDFARLAPNAYHSAETLNQIADRLAASPATTTVKVGEVERLRAALRSMLEEFDAEEFGSEGQMRTCADARAALATNTEGGK